MIYVRQTTRVTNKGIGFLGALTLAFIVLKLTGFINWSWWFVTLPMWILPAIFVGGGIIIAIIWLLIQAWKAQAAKKRARARANLGS
jgi:hypothetical protein